MSNIERARELRRNQTEAERLLWFQLRGRRLQGFKFRRQFPIENYIVDFARFSEKLIIELDGGHHAEAEQKQNDIKRMEVLQSRGFRVIRFWNNQVHQEMDGVLHNIVKNLKNEHQKQSSIPLNKFPLPWERARVRAFPPNYASAWGEDQSGLWFDLSIHQVEQRFRWVSAGEFLMGSPESEQERVSLGRKETQHYVTLTQGFWLADTACTQELWQLVMGDNPSNFDDGLKNPVESVSWLDIQRIS